MIEQVIQQWNLNKAYQKVCANKGAGGVDGMETPQLKAHLQTNGEALVEHMPQWELSTQPDQRRGNTQGERQDTDAWHPNADRPGYPASPAPGA